jgi:hypothetical protein
MKIYKLKNDIINEELKLFYKMNKRKIENSLIYSLSSNIYVNDKFYQAKYYSDTDNNYIYMQLEFDRDCDLYKLAKNLYCFKYKSHKVLSMCSIEFVI